MERENKTIYSFSYGAQALVFNLHKTEVKNNTVIRFIKKIINGMKRIIQKPIIKLLTETVFL